MASCAHAGPQQIITMAEGWLREQGLSQERWAGLRVRHAENTPGTLWASVVTDIERRGDQWIVTRIDRNPQPLESREGLSLVSENQGRS